MRFSDRVAAGRQLGAALHAYRQRKDVLVLALPRGGVPVAAQVARELQAPLDLLLVRKLGVPGQEELAMGAIATGGAMVLNQDLVEMLGIGAETIEATKAVESRELARRQLAYRGERPFPELQDRCVIVVDDGVATGATMRAGVAALRQHRPKRLVIAVPVAPPDTLAVLRQSADEVVCLATPSPFYGVGAWYEDFSQTSDEEVREILLAAWTQPATPSREQPRPGLG